jgi:hypothetical protein
VNKKSFLLAALVGLLVVSKTYGGKDDFIDFSGACTLHNKEVPGLVTYIPKEYAPGKQDDTLVVRNCPQCNLEGGWRNAALFSFSK